MLRNYYRSVVRMGGLYDLLVTVVFATPWTFELVHQQLTKFSTLPTFEPMHVMFANLLGSIVTVWSILRIRNPEPIYGLYDGVARGLFLAWMLYYLLAMNGSPLVWFFTFFEIVFGITQCYGYWLLRKVEWREPTNCKVVRYFALVS